MNSNDFDSLSTAPAGEMEARFCQVIDNLVDHRYSINPRFFAVELINALYQELCDYVQLNKLRAAEVGKGAQQERIEAIRGDDIRWLNGETEAQLAFLAIMEQYRQQLNQQLFLGLSELEAHFACYPPGTGYQTHLDSFQNNNLRRITIVVYLNPQWEQSDGGQLQIFDGQRLIAEVLPENGTFVSFVSEEIPHQVAITNKERFSIAGWFRVRDPLLI